MATKKTIEFKAKFDLAEFDKGAQKVQERLRQIYNPISTSSSMQKAQSMMSALGIGTVSSQDEARRRSFDTMVKQNQKELEQIIQKQWQSAQKLEVSLEKRIQKLQKLQEFEKGLLLTNQDTARVKKQIADEEERISNTRAKIGNRAMNIQSATESLSDSYGYTPGSYQGLQAGPWSRIGRAYSMYGVGGAAGMAGRMFGTGNIIAGAVGAATAGYNFYTQQGLAQRNYELSVAQAQGNVISGGPQGQMLSSIYSGQGNRLYYESAQRRAAAVAASKYRNNLEDTTNSASVINRALIGANAGFAGGMMAGGAFGVPTAGVAPLITGAIGGIGGAGLSLIRDLSNPLTRATILGDTKGREALLSNETVKRYQESLAAEKEKNPLKFLAQDNYLQNYKQDLGVQRALGLSDQDFYGREQIQSGNVVGGMYNNLLNRGFTRDEIFSNISGVLGAGGSTAQASSATGLAQRMQRGGLSNASQMLGSISRITGGVGETEDVAVRVMSEAFKRGLDKSEFRQESVKFQDVLVQAMATAGVVSAEGAKNAAGFAAGFVSAPTNMQSIANAQSAKDFYESNLKNTLNQSIQAAGLMDIPGLSNDSARSLLNMTTDQLNDPGNMQVMAAAEEAGISRDELLKKVNASKQNAVTVTKKSQERLDLAADQIRKRQKEIMATGVSAGEARTQAIQSFMETSESGRLMNAIGNESSGFESLNLPSRRNFIAGALNQALGGTSDFGDVPGALAKAAGGQAIGNAQEDAAALQQAATNEVFVQQGYTPLKQAAEQAKELGKAAMKAAIALEAASKTDSAAAIKEMSNNPMSIEPPRSGAAKGR